MKHLDLIGVNTEWRATLRCRLSYSQGTNWVWHLDGYDKLKPYGFEIHGCIDGYSRPVLWLSILQSNKDPTEMCNPYFHYLLIAKRVSQKIVVDWGTENVNIAVSQRFLRRNYSDNSSQYQSFQFGKSITNRGIESFWSQLRRSCTDSWIRFFKEIVHGGVYDNSDSLQVECFKFCYFSLIQKELIDIKDCWNNHPIRQWVQLDMEARPTGRPDFFYFVQDISSEYLLKYDNQDIFLFEEEICTDEKNTFYICFMNFLCCQWMNMADAPEADAPTEALLLFQEN